MNSEKFTPGTSVNNDDAADEFTFAKHHHRLDYTRIGCVAERINRCLINFDDRPVVCHSEQAMRQFLQEHYGSETSTEAKLSPIDYAAIVRFSHSDGVAYFLDDQSLATMQEAQRQDLRFNPAFEVTSSELGTLVEPRYDLYRDQSFMLQEQIDAFVVGYCPLNAENEILQSSNGRHRIFGTLDDALALENATRVLPLTFRSLTEHKGQGYRFAANEIVRGRIKDLRGWQSFCDVMREVDED